ncbi:MAG: PEP-CTERM sorting domain-containing protein [Acetobacteraceae bacterium]
MKIATCLVAAAVLAGGGISAAHATVATENIDGVVIPVGIVAGGNQIQSAFINETSISNVGDTLSGIGYVSAVALGTNPSAQTWSNGQNGVMLAFIFSGYTVSSIALPSGGTNGTVDFTGGSVDFYTLAAGTNLSTGTVAGDEALVKSGTLWLATSAAVEAPGGVTLTGSIPPGDSASNFVTAGNGSGYLDATGGPAGASYHTGTFTNPFDPLGGSDMSFTSDFSNAAGGSDFPITGSATLKANTVLVPEPMSAALLGFGVLALAAVYRRRAVR